VIFIRLSLIQIAGFIVDGASVHLRLFAASATHCCLQYLQHASHSRLLFEPPILSLQLAVFACKYFPASRRPDLRGGFACKCRGAPAGYPAGDRTAMLDFRRVEEDEGRAVEPREDESTARLGQSCAALRSAGKT